MDFCGNFTTEQFGEQAAGARLVERLVVMGDVVKIVLLLSLELKRRKAEPQVVWLGELGNGAEALTLEVAVEGEDVGNAEVAQHLEAHAVNEAETALVGGE